MTKRFGARGVVLTLFGIPWIMYGLAVLLSVGARFSNDPVGGSLHFMDRPYWGWLWIGSGVFAIFAMFTSKNYPILQSLAYGFFAVPISLWTLCYLASWMLFETTNGEMGRDRAYLGACIFGNFLILVLYLARQLRDVEPTR